MIRGQRLHCTIGSVEISLKVGNATLLQLDNEEGKELTRYLTDP